MEKLLGPLPVTFLETGEVKIYLPYDEDYYFVVTYKITESDPEYIGQRLERKEKNEKKRSDLEDC
jgi:hypothetical protein